MGTHRRYCPAEAAPTCDTAHRTHGVARPAQAVGPRADAPRAAQRSAGAIRCLCLRWDQGRTMEYRTGVALTVAEVGRTRTGLAGGLWNSISTSFVLVLDGAWQEVGAPKRAPAGAVMAGGR
jgi:hypothetical protein